MNRFDQIVDNVISFLREHKYKASTVSAHNRCYGELRQHLSEIGQDYSFTLSLDWNMQKSKCLSRRKSASYKHFIIHLDDMDRLGTIPPHHLAHQFPPYTMLSETFMNELHIFMESIETEAMREVIRMRCSTFLLFLQDNGLSSVSKVNYGHILEFLSDDSHKTEKSKDRFESAVRRMLAFHHRELGVSIGLSYACNKQIKPYILLPAAMSGRVIQEIAEYRIKSLSYSLVKYYDAIDGFTGCLKNHLYSKSVIEQAKRTCKLLYLFFDMNDTGYSLELCLLWLSEVKPVLGTGWKQIRRIIMLFHQYATLGDIIPEKVCNYKDTSFSKLPRWCVDKVTEYLSLRIKEGLTKSSIDMCRSSCIRFCNFLAAHKISSFHEIEAKHLVLFNLTDPHRTAEGKSAYNVRIRMFLEYLEEGMLSDKPMLHKALPCQCANKERVTVVFNRDEMAKIATFCRDRSSPRELRKTAMVMLGLRMGLRASDIVNLKFTDIDWAKQIISIIQTKTQKSLSLPLPVEVANSLYKYVRDGRPRSDSPFLFIHHRVPYKKLDKGACVQALHAMLGNNVCGGFHTTRKTFATNLLRAGVGVNTIIDSLGHSTEDTVNKYLSLDEGRMRLCAMSLAEAGISLEGGLSL